MTPTQAKQQAQVNANYFGVPYVIFMDTSLGWRVERYDDTLTCHREGTILQPQPSRGVT